MNWKLVFTLALFGVAMGIAAVLGFYPPSLEWVLWLIISLFCAWIIAKKAATKLFLHGFMVGLIDGLVAPVITAIFFSTYMANNPSYAERASKIPGGLDPRIFGLILAPMVGKVFKKQPAQTPAS
jgi:uncharacterized membrane protein